MTVYHIMCHQNIVSQQASSGKRLFKEKSKSKLVRKHIIKIKEKAQYEDTSEESDSIDEIFDEE